MVTGSVVVANIVYVQQEELLQEIAELHGEVKGIKVAQDTQIRAIRDEVKDDTKKQMVQSMQYVVQRDTGQPHRRSHGISDVWCAEIRLSFTSRTQPLPR